MSPEETRVFQIPSKKRKVAEWIAITILAMLCAVFIASTVINW